MPTYTHSTDKVLTAWAMKALHVYVQEHYHECGRIIELDREPTGALMSDKLSDGHAWHADVALQDGKTMTLSVIQKPDRWYVSPV